jgi:hypothetical protein
MGQNEGFEVLADDPIQGAASFVDQRKGMEMERLSEELRSHVLQNDIAVPGARGPIETFRHITERIRGRKFVKDLGIHEFDINWLTFHVPQGGKGTLKMANSAESRFGFRLSMVGLGFGSGRSTTISVNHDFGERNNCLVLFQRAQVQILAYSSKNSQEPDEIQLNILKLLSRGQTSLTTCADCLGLNDMSMIEQAGQAIDLTKDPTGHSYKEKLSLAHDSEVELGLPLSLPLQFTASVAVRRNIRIDAEVSYEFPGGYCFTPFRKLTGWEDLHFWRRTQKCL